MSETSPGDCVANAPICASKVHTCPTGPGHTTLVGGTAGIVWRLPGDGPNVRPYLITGLGMYGVSVTRAGLASTSRTGIAWSGGGGLSLVGVGPALGFVEARFITIRTSGGATNLFPLSAGFAVREPW